MFILWICCCCAAPGVAQEKGNSLEQAEKQYLKKKKEIADERAKSSKQVLAAYVLDLDNLQRRAQKAGALDPLLEINEELKTVRNFEEIGMSVNQGSIAQLKSIVGKHQPKLKAAKAKARTTQVQLDKVFLNVLNGQMESLTKSGKIDQAIVVRERIEEVKMNIRIDDDGWPKKAVQPVSPVVRSAPPAGPAKAIGGWDELPMEQEAVKKYIIAKLGQPNAYVSVSVYNGAIQSLNIRGCKLRNLDVLAGCPTVRLSLYDTDGLDNLDALRTFPNLNSLTVQDPVKNTRGLRAAPKLRQVDLLLRTDQLSDIAKLPLSSVSLSLKHAREPIKELMEMPLIALTLRDGALSPKWRMVIQRLPRLGSLSLFRVDVNNDLTFLKNQKLRTLRIFDAKNLTSLVAISGMQLNQLSVPGSQVSNLAPLKGMPLQSLDISRTRVNNDSLRLLSTLPLQILIPTGLTLDLEKLFIHSNIRNILGIPKDKKEELEKARREKAR